MKEINIENFEKELLKSKMPVLVDFNADWCGPCQMLKPILEQLADEQKKVKFVSVNVDAEDELAMRYNVSSIPCLIMFKNGEEIGRSIGLKSKEDLEEFLGE